MIPQAGAVSKDCYGHCWAFARHNPTWNARVQFWNAKQSNKISTFEATCNELKVSERYWKISVPVKSCLVQWMTPKLLTCPIIAVLVAADWWHWGSLLVIRRHSYSSIRNFKCVQSQFSRCQYLRRLLPPFINNKARTTSRVQHGVF